MKPKFDVLGLGAVAVDDLIVVGEYPPADAKVRVKKHERQCGGLTAIALITAARLGGKCAYAGVLGNDELSRFVIAQMRGEKVNVSLLRRRSNAPPVHSFIVVDDQHHTRNVFSHRQVGYRIGANWPPTDAIRSAKVLFVDHSEVASMIRAARIARRSGIPVVADLERVSGPRFSELLHLCNHLIVPWKLAVELTGESRPHIILPKLWSRDSEVVAVTRGKKGCWFIDRTQPNRVQHQPIFPVKVLDTTGCGDVFHGAYAWALAQGLPCSERIRLASAAAALQATRLGGQAGIPSLKAVRRLIAKASDLSQRRASKI